MNTAELIVRARARTVVRVGVIEGFTLLDETAAAARGNA